MGGWKLRELINCKFSPCSWQLGKGEGWKHWTFKIMLAFNVTISDFWHGLVTEKCLKSPRLMLICKHSLWLSLVVIQSDFQNLKQRLLWVFLICWKNAATIPTVGSTTAHKSWTMRDLWRGWQKSLSFLTLFEAKIMLFSAVTQHLVFYPLPRFLIISSSWKATRLTKIFICIFGLTQLL